MKYAALVRSARKAKRYAYAPYSNFRVGAAVLTRSGNIYTGCNIESSSYSLTICAERTALFKALSESRPRFAAMAITSDAEELIPPCGACRQVIFDLAGDIDIVLAGSGRRRAGRLVEVIKLSSLLPFPFSKQTLQKIRKKT